MIATKTTYPTLKIPPLENGDKLTRTEFERRYHAMSKPKKAELIEGIVYNVTFIVVIKCKNI